MKACPQNFVSKRHCPDCPGGIDAYERGRRNGHPLNTPLTFSEYWCIQILLWWRDKRVWYDGGGPSLWQMSAQIVTIKIFKIVCFQDMSFLDGTPNSSNTPSVISLTNRIEQGHVTGAWRAQEPESGSLLLSAGYKFYYDMTMWWSYELRTRPWARGKIIRESSYLYPRLNSWVGSRPSYAYCTWINKRSSTCTLRAFDGHVHVHLNSAIRHHYWIHHGAMNDLKLLNFTDNCSNELRTCAKNAAAAAELQIELRSKNIKLIRCTQHGKHSFNIL